MEGIVAGVLTRAGCGLASSLGTMLKAAKMPVNLAKKCFRDKSWLTGRSSSPKSAKERTRRKFQSKPKFPTSF